MGYWESVAPPDHTQSEALCEERERRQEEKGRSGGMEVEMRLWSGGETESDMSLVQRYALVNSTLIQCQTVEP